MSIQLVMPSNHLILCHFLLLLPSIFPSIRVFSSESILSIRWPCLENPKKKKKVSFWLDRSPYFINEGREISVFLYSRATIYNRTSHISCFCFLRLTLGVDILDFMRVVAFIALFVRHLLCSWWNHKKVYLFKPLLRWIDPSHQWQEYGYSELEKKKKI